MNLVVDYGNSAAKVGIFEHQTLVGQHSFTTPEALQKFLRDAAARNFIVSSVKTNPEIISSWVGKAEKKLILTHELPLPVKNLYSTPATLGVDRLAGVCGAWQLFP